MKRDNILAAAARLFAERGYANTPTVLLAQEAGVAEGTIFRHFKSKDEILQILIENVRTLLLNDINKMLEARPPATGLEMVLAITREFYVFVRRNPMEFGLVFRDAPSRYRETDEFTFNATKAMYTELIGRLEQALKMGQGDGSVDTGLHPHDTAALHTCTLIGFSRAIHFGFIFQEKGESQLLANLLENTAKFLQSGKNERLKTPASI